MNKYFPYESKEDWEAAQMEIQYSDSDIFCTTHLSDEEIKKIRAQKPRELTCSDDDLPF